MNLDINIDAEKINKEITEAVAKSAIGETLKKQIEKTVDHLSQSYNNPFEQIIKNEINCIVREKLLTDFKEQLDAFVKEKITQDFANKVIDKIWDSFQI